MTGGDSPASAEARRLAAASFFAGSILGPFLHTALFLLPWMLAAGMAEALQWSRTAAQVVFAAVTVPAIGVLAILGRHLWRTWAARWAFVTGVAIIPVLISLGMLLLEASDLGVSAGGGLLGFGLSLPLSYWRARTQTPHRVANSPLAVEQARPADGPQVVASRKRAARS